MKVLRIFHGGVVERYQRRDEEIAALGHRVLLVVPTSYRELPEPSLGVRRTCGNLSVEPCKVHGPSRNPLWWYDVRQLKSIVRGFSPDVVDIHEEPYSLAMLSVLRAIGPSVPVAFRSSQNVEKSYPPPFSFIQRQAFGRSAAAYVPTNQARDVLLSKGFSRQISVVGNGVELQADHGSRRSENGRARRVLFAGRYTDRKGFEDLIVAALRVTSLEFHFAGGSSNRILGLHDDRMLDHGVLTYRELSALYLRSDALVVPSRVLPGWTEQFCRSLVEGMAHGLVPIVSTSGALTDVAGRSALTFSAGSPSSLEDALEAFASLSEEELNVKRDLARRDAQRFSWQHTSKQITMLYGGAVQ